MDNFKISLEFLEMQVPEKIRFALEISKRMDEAKDVFRNPLLNLAELNLMIEDVIANYEVIDDGVPHRRAMLYQSVDYLDKGLLLLSRYVSVVANANPEIIRKSGFHIEA